MTATAIPLLIIGAGPFGLALAAWAGHHGLGYTVVGRPMEFWREHMPEGMLLRSGPDWHLDPMDQHTIDAFLALRRIELDAAQPLSLPVYLDYAEWFRQQKQIDALSAYVARLDRQADGMFAATLDNGETLLAHKVVVAVGFRYFAAVPEEFRQLVPPARLSHTCHTVDLAALAGRRCLLIGGRQSAFEWAALLAEQGAAAVHVAYRHDTPAFTASDWSWVDPLVDELARDPGWVSRLAPEERRALDHRFWCEGRQKLEPWLRPHLHHPAVSLWPRTSLVSAQENASGALDVALDNGVMLAVDQVILATGYQVDIARIPFMDAGNLAGRVSVQRGSPSLDDRFQSSVPGLYFTSMAATRDFGAFLAFTVSARASARVIGAAVQASLA